VDRQQARSRLHFDDESLFYDEVESMTMLEQKALVDDGQYALPFDAQAPKSKLVSEVLLVHRLEQPGPNMPMHFDARRDELIRTILKSSRLPAFLFHFPSSTRAPPELQQFGICTRLISGREAGRRRPTR